jgi:xylulokinase
MPIYAGFDCSTQSLTVLAIEVDGPDTSVICTRSLDFDGDLPHYGTSHGVIPGDDAHVAVSPAAMWAEALDRMMAALAGDLGSRALSRVAAISGSAQQHGSVYLEARANDVLASLDPARELVDQVRGIFARPLSPVWKDSSTTVQCAAITSAAGGPDALARTTGSCAFERFTGPQIRKFAETEPGAYARTDRIHLVSSFLASLLVARHAPLDPGDASGMNMMDLASRSWDPRLLAATAPGLAERLPAIAPASAVVGRLSPYWQRRYGFPSARVVIWSGDNPSSLVGVGLIAPGRRAISLGTSDTVFGYMAQPVPAPSGRGHVFGAPTGDYMGLTCFRNGSLARERVRDAFGLDWRGFSDVLRTTRAGNRGRILLPWFEPEITPAVARPGVHRYGLDPGDMEGNVRGVVEGQMLAMARHSAWMGGSVDGIHATGGASANPEILQVMADVFAADVYRMPVENSACLGAALRAYHADRLATGAAISWEEVVDGLAAPDPSIRIAPDTANIGVYRELARVHEAVERDALNTTSNYQLPTTKAVPNGRP